MPPGATGSRFSTSPEFPALELQAPGGTVETDEDIAAAALREFYEETGIQPGTPLTPLTVHDHCFGKDGTEVRHRRHYFHTPPQGRTTRHLAASGNDARSAAEVQRSSVSAGSNFDDARTWLGYGMQHGLPLLS